MTPQWVRGGNSAESLTGGDLSTFSDHLFCPQAIRYELMITMVPHGLQVKHWDAMSMALHHAEPQVGRNVRYAPRSSVLEKHPF